ncbi:RNA-binding domain-containing protein [Albibacterium bauzanense]|uniref:ATP-dependent DNA helicase RecG n=1 Tax=Albibacterium bauzanense TaxID=653929 RepID=A0A4R1LWR4_9SPHI|nr:RNA-binding domain-containing protein [Albibacterium bauzanense]TCK82904.1 ATP-dependent DNA helicase RecG [Albibacterium bauzanense]
MEELLNQLLQSDTESEILEFKEARGQYDKNKLGKYFSALSNEANLKNKTCAWLLLGIDNNKQIVGTSITDAQLNDYKAEIAFHTSPSLNFRDAYRVDVENKKVIMLEIPAAPQGIPVAWKGHYYGRDGESLGGLNIEELERIRNQARVFDWSVQLVRGASINDLSEEAIAKARVQFAEKNHSLKDEMAKWDNITFLNKAKVTINGQITNTAILLLGKAESEHFISPATSKITWILKDRDGIEKDYEHFTCPLFLSVQQVYGKIRNIKYRYLQEGTLFPDEVNQFEPYIIREALNNSIAHQDYMLGGKILVIEREDGVLTFSNSGSFIPRSIEKVIAADAPENRYRNPFLANAMVNLNMIDTIGSGIKKMFVIQKDKFFPLPEYDLSNQKVTVSITGRIVDVNYARKLAQLPDLRLTEIILLDKVAKNKPITDPEVRQLKAKKLIEGRKPNFHISAGLAKGSGQEVDYIKMRGIDDDYYMKLIEDYLLKFKKGTRNDFENMLLDKLPDVLSVVQKKTKVKNLLQKLKTQGKIETDKKRQWVRRELDEI